MIGTRIESSPSLPLMSIFCFIGWVGVCLTAILEKQINLAIAGIPLFLAALLSFWNREQQLVFEIESQGLSFGDTGRLIEYDSIQTLNAVPSQSENEQFDIVVRHVEGTLTIPRSISHSSHSLLQFLKSRQPKKPVGFVHTALTEYLLDQQKLFGTDKVFLFSPRLMPSATILGKVGRLIGLWILLTGILWAFAATFYTNWTVPGALSVLFGSIFFLASFATNDPVKRQIKNWRESSLIVTPSGIALIQGNLKGKLRWDEVLEVAQAKPKPFTIVRVLPGLRIQVKGSQITIADIYDESIDTIHDCIMAYFSGKPKLSSQRSPV